jgi:LmbE family N-acetylglucosaminyl deacetylase
LIGLDLARRSDQALQVLCLGAHSDDIEIGCGGTLLSLKRRYPKIRLHWVVFTAGGRRRDEANRGVELFAEGCEREVSLLHFRDGFLPYQGAEVKEAFEKIKAEIEPDLIFTQWGADAHQDHRLLSELTWNTFRNHMILEYEIPKYDGDMGRPNFYVPLDIQIVEAKIDYLFDAFQTQQGKKWFDRDTFRGLMRLRGMESNAQSGYAEAFHCRKVVLQPGV